MARPDDRISNLTRPPNSCTAARTFILGPPFAALDTHLVYRGRLDPQLLAVKTAQEIAKPPPQSEPQQSLSVHCPLQIAISQSVASMPSVFASIPFLPTYGSTGIDTALYCGGAIVIALLAGYVYLWTYREWAIPFKNLPGAYTLSYSLFRHANDTRTRSRSLVHGKHIPNHPCRAWSHARSVE